MGVPPALRTPLISPQRISAWANKILPNGERVGQVKNPSTFHYKTNKPQKDGLFCERTFGPIKVKFLLWEILEESEMKKKTHDSPNPTVH